MNVGDSRLRMHSAKRDDRRPPIESASLRWRCLLRVICLSATVLSLSACGPLYIHNAGVEKSTASAKAEMDKLKVDAIFDNEAAYLTKLEQDELTAIRERNAAQRDAELLLFLRGDGANSGLELMLDRVDGRLRSIAVKTDRKSDVKLWRIVQAALDDSDEKVPGHEFATLLTAYKNEFFPRIVDTGGTTLLSPSGTNLDAALKTLKDDKDALAKDDEAGKKAAADADQALARATTALAPGKTAESAFADVKTQVDAWLNDANPYVRQYVSAKLAAKVGELVAASGPAKTTDTPLTTEARAGLGFLQASLAVGDAFSNPPKIPHPNALAATQAWLQYVKSGAELGIAERNAAIDVDQARVKAVAAQIYFLSRAAEELQQFSSARLRKDEGLSTLLAKGKDPNQAVTGSLMYYADAWNRGFTQATLVEREGYIMQRRAKLERSRRAGEAWVGTLKPGVETLAAYGSGGIDPQAVANLIGAFGLGAIAGGVNK